MARLVVGISGASGTILAFRFLQAAAQNGHELELVMTPAACQTAAHEMGKQLSSPRALISKLPQAVQRQITLHQAQDVGASICSGSYKTDGMLILPCSMTTVAALAHGFADTCLRRAADVTLKERRPLVIVPRETPLHQIHLQNLLQLSKSGVIIIPPTPAWYQKPQTLEDVENYIVGKVFDALGIEHALYPQWNPRK